MNIVSFQSRVSYGIVGNVAAEFCLRRAGHEVCAVDTVWFSNHAGYGSCHGRAAAAPEIADIVAGIDAVGVFATCDAVLSGYLGTVAAGDIALGAVARARAASPGALYCCDPVMGDRASGLYVEERLVPFFCNEAVPAADIAVPNHFELEVLSGRPVLSLADARAAALTLIGRGPGLVCVSSLMVADLPGRIATMLVGADGAWLVETPWLAFDAKGAGDVLTALLLGHLLSGADRAAALSLAVSSTFAAVAATVAGGRRELALVEAQDALVTPPRRFAACRL